MAGNALLDLYDRDYEAPGPAGDPNSAGYLLQGPAAPMDTSNVLRTMKAQQDAQEREGPEAAARLLMLGVPAAHATVSGNLPKAIGRHIAQERKEGNRLLQPIPLGLGIANTALAQGLGIQELMAGQPGIGVWGAALNGLVNAYLSKNHIEATSRILQHLNRTEPKAATTLY